MTPVIRISLIWLAGAAVVTLLQLNYQVVEWVALLATALLFGFAVLLSWSAVRVNVANATGIFKLALMSLVVGLMISQALDVAYQSAALPAGGRFSGLIEVAYFAAQVFPIAYLAGRFWPRSKPKIKPDTSAR